MSVPGDQLISDLAAIVGAEGVATDAEAMAPHLEDSRQRARAAAACVVKPRATQEVSEIVRLCARAGAPITPQGGNTGLAFGALPLDAPQAVILSLQRMAAVRRVQPLAMTMEVEAGCTLRAAKDAAEAANRFFPVTIGSEGAAQIGGVLAANAGGVNVLRYGMARSTVLGLEVVLADGTIVNGLRALRKDNAGYDWKQLFIGSEGTFGVITAAVLKLSPLPTRKATAFVAVQTPAQAMALLSLAQERLGDALSAFELIAALCVEVVAKHFDHKPPIPIAPWQILLEAASMSDALMDEVEQFLADALEQGVASDAAIAQNSSQAAQMWLLRERMANMGNREGRMISHDISVPIELIPDFIAAANAKIAAEFPGARNHTFGHVGDGNLHYNIFVPPGPTMGAVNACVHRVVIDFGGSISAEHGIGRYRRADLLLNKSDAELALMRRIKAMLDPDGVMNPGAVF